MEDIEPSIPHVPPDEAILSAGCDMPATWNLDVSYVDDTALAIPVHADQVIKTLRSTILVLRRGFRQFRLPLNFSAGKTEALVDAFGPGARALRMALCNTHACSVTCADEHGSTTIRIYLGSIVSAGQHVTKSTSSYFSSQSCYGRHSCSCSLCSKHRATNRECGALFLCFEQGFSTSILSGRSSILPRCARWKAHIAILRALPVVFPVLMVFLPRAPHRCSPKCHSPPCRMRWPRLAFCFCPDF